jgi:hypothetical protein
MCVLTWIYSLVIVAGKVSRVCVCVSAKTQRTFLTGECFDYFYVRTEGMDPFDVKASVIQSILQSKT